MWQVLDLSDLPPAYEAAAPACFPLREELSTAFQLWRMDAGNRAGERD